MIKKQNKNTEWLLVIVAIILIFLVYKQDKFETSVVNIDDKISDIRKQKDSIIFLENKVLSLVKTADSLSKVKVIEKKKQKQIIVKYVPVYEKIVSTPDSLQYIITTDLLSKHRSIKIKK